MFWPFRSDRPSDPPATEPSLESRTFIHAEVSNQLDHQFPQIDALNARAGQLIGMAGGILALTIGLRPAAHSREATAVFIAGLIPFSVLFLLVGRAWRIQGWRRDPAPPALWSRYRLWPEDYLMAQVTVNMIQAHEQNQQAANDKVRLLRWAQFALGAEVLAVAVVAVALPYVT